jgi:hypothetical protein
MLDDDHCHRKAVLNREPGYEALLVGRFWPCDPDAQWRILEYMRQGSQGLRPAAPCLTCGHMRKAEVEITNPFV